MVERSTAPMAVTMPELLATRITGNVQVSYRLAAMRASGDPGGGSRVSER
jgi:hypothetical protein